MLVSLQNSYFYLFRAAVELNSSLSGLTLTECYTQEKDKLFISIPSSEHYHLHLIISINPQEYSIQLKEQHFKAKKNTINFFSDCLPQTIISIDIAKHDRIIRICLDRAKIYIVFRGNKSNCYFENEDSDLQSFKKVMENHLDKMKEEFSSLIWLHKYEQMLPDLEPLKSVEEMRNQKYISKDIFKLIEEVDTSSFGVTKIIKNIMNDMIAIGTDSESGKSFFQPFSTIPQNTNLDMELFSSYFEAFSSFSFLQRETSKTDLSQNEIEKTLRKEIEKISKKQVSLKSRVEKGSKEKEYRKYGELILSNLRDVTKGMSKISLYDYEQECEIQITLKQELSPNEMVNYYFDKARSENIKYEKSCKLYEQVNQKLSKLNEFLTRLKNNLQEKDFAEIKKEIRMNTEINLPEEKKEKIPYRHFIIDDKYNFYIGKDSKNNDQLTTKFAKQNDFWFHARSVAGSHGVLRVENTKEVIPKKILEKAASITAFYSKAKASKLAPVTYTLKKYVTKNSRHEPGQVLVLKEQVLLVKPEIPVGCIYSNE